MAAWAVAIASTSTVGMYGIGLAILFRPLLFWVLLAWPIGRLGVGDRAALVGLAVALTVCWGAWVLLEPLPFDGSRDNPLAIADLQTLSTALHDLGTLVVMQTAGIVVAATLVRRHRRLPATARRLALPVTLVGVYAGLGDVALVLIDRFLTDATVDDGGRTALGGLVAVVDQGRFVAVPVVLTYVALHARAVADEGRRVRCVEIGPSGGGVAAAVSAAIGDPSARIGYHGGGDRWIDADGLPLDLGGAGRHVATVVRETRPIAAIDLDARFADRPTTVEAAVAAAASVIEHDRATALARARLREARAARRTIVEVEDATRRRVERDLHDGAQQRLVGLALQASLAERTGIDEVGVATLAQGVAEARQELRDLAAGRLPALVAERGLAAAIGTLAATTPLAVEVRLSTPASLPNAVAGVAWFVVAEAVANVIKHAHASTLRIDGRVDRGALHLTVADDGRGGATLAAGSGLRGLGERIAGLGGRLEISSPTDGGTEVTLAIPVTT
jgi:signal transduction histidine kinase